MSLMEDIAKLNANNKYIRLINEETRKYKKNMQHIVDMAFYDDLVDDHEFDMLCEYALERQGIK